MPMWKARPFQKGRAARGFAMVEVLVTVAIVVLIGTIAIFAFGRSDRAQLHNEAAALALVLQQARLQAAETGQPIEVIYSQEAQTLSTPTGRHALARSVTSPTGSARVLIRPSGENEGLDLVLVAGDQSRSVTLDWLTGQIRVTP